LSIADEKENTSLRNKSSLFHPDAANSLRDFTGMKLLVFAHTPPPHHGQSYMVKLMLEGFGGDERRQNGLPASPLSIECYHVNARFSRELSDVGEFQGAKIFLIFWFCAQAIWIRFRHQVDYLYYVPAPGKAVALYRDWLIMFLCRPFFKKMALHWHAAGLAKWLETSTNINSRAATYRLFRPVDLSIVLSRYNFADAEKLLSRRIRVVDNGIPDPCPDFDERIGPLRQQRFALRRSIFTGQPCDQTLVVNVLFLAHCTREKGIFAAVAAVLQANRELAARRLPIQLKLLTAGNFVSNDEKLEFDRLCQNPEAAMAVAHHGFVSGQQKDQLLQNADMFLFPTCYLGENQPVNLIEAMAFGLPIITTRWRSLPEMLPPDYSGLISGQNADEIAASLLNLLATESGERLRQTFLARFALEQHLSTLAAALHSMEND
jgi:glycosyltransferase involved in cell wall biosynthesis